MMAAAGAAITVPLLGAVKAAADFEFAMDGVNAALGGMDTATMDLLEQQALDLGASSKFSAEEIAAVQENLAKSGLNAEDLLNGATKAVIDLAAATGEQLEPSARLVTGAMQKFGLEAEDMSSVADVMTGALNESAMTLPDLERGLNSLGPTMATLNRYAEMTAQGLDGEKQAMIDTAAVLALFNQRGLKAADTGISLGRMFNELADPTSDAAEAMAKYGIDAFDANRNMKPLPDLLDEIGEGLSGLSDEARIKAIGEIFGEESKDVVTQMAAAFKEGGLGDDLRQITEDISKEGLAAEQAAIRQDNLTGSVEKLGGALSGLAVQMGTPLLDPLNEVTKGVTEMVDVLANAPEPVQRLVAEFGALTGGLLGFGGLAALGTGQVLKLGETFGKAGLSLPKFAAGLGLVGLAIGAGLLAYETNFLGFADTVDAAMENGRKAIDAFGRSFDEAFAGNKAAGLNDMAAGAAALGTALNAAIGMDRVSDFRKLSNALQTFGDTWQEGIDNGIDPWVNALQSASRATGELGLDELSQDLGTLGRAWGAMEENMRETEGQMPQLNRELSALQHGLGVVAEEAGVVAEAEEVPSFFDNLGTQASIARQDLDELAHAINTQDWESVGAQLIAGQPNYEKFFGEVGPMIGEFKDQFADFDLAEATQSASDQVQGWFQAMSRHLFGGLDSMAGPGERNVEGAFSQLANDIGVGFAGLGDMVMEALPDQNPFEGVQQWLQDGMDEITRFFQPQEMAAGLGGAGMDDTSGISQMFSGMVEGIGAGMDQAVTDLGALAEEKKTGFKNALGDFFGPIGQFLFPSEDALASEAAPLGDPAEIGKQFGESMLKTFTDPGFEDGLRESIDAMPDEAFQATGAALLGAISTGMKTALTQPAPETDGGAAGQTLGQQMIGSLATGLTDSLMAEGTTELFIPVANELGHKLNTALGQVMTQTLGSAEQAGPVGPEAAGGIGAQMVRSLATGLTDSIIATPPETFVPVAGALGTKLSEAMTTSMQATQAAGPTGVPTQVPGFGQQMVQGMATGLTDSITAAPAEMFVPVTGALGAKLGEAMSLAAQQTQAPGPTGVPTQVPGVGTSMVQGLATGLAESITAAPIETFAPVGQSLGTKLGEALNLAMTQAPSAGSAQMPGGMTGTGGATGGGLGEQMMMSLATGLTDSITNAPIETFAPVGAALGTKLGEALQAAVESGAQGGQQEGQQGAAGVGVQMGEAVGQMLVSGVEQADFTPVGTSLSQKIGETLQTVAEGGGEFDVSEQVGTSVGQMLQSGIDSADFSGVGDSLTTQLSDQLTSAIDEVSSQIEETMSQMTEAISEAVSQMGEAIGEATEQVSQAVEEMASGIEEAVSAVSDAVAEMSASVEEAAGQMEEAAQSAVDAASEIGSAAEEAASAVESAMQSMAAAVQAAAGAIEGAAGQIIAALNSIAGAAAAAGAAIGSALAGGFSGELGIASPSKVFVGFGKNIVEGLAKGMGGNVQILSRGSTSLAKQSMATLASAIGMGSPAKKFMPHGAAITQGMLAGMIQEAKGRMQSAMGQMAGAVESGMGKVKSAMASGMERVRAQGQQEAAAVGADTATAAAEGMTSEERAAERAARRLWRRAYRELMNGVGVARFLGESWAREFWEGMLDSGGSLAFAQYVTQQIVGAAEDAVTAAAGAVQGLATQLQIVGDTIGTLESDVASLESQLAGIDQQIAAQAQQERLRAVQDELAAQREITRELQARLKTEVSAAHAAHIRAVQTRSLSAQADYEHKLRTAQATDTAVAESQVRESELAKTLEAMQAAIAQAAQDELAARRAAIAEELAMKRQALAEEMALQASLLAAQNAAQQDYSSAVIAGSQDRIRQLQRELRHADGAEQRRTLQAQIALEQQRIVLAQQLATALQQQAAAGAGEGLAQANAQVQFLTQQIAALGEVDVGSLLGEIVSTLETTASSMSTAAGELESAATALGETDATAAIQGTTQATAEFGTAAGVAARGAFSMANAYDEAMAKMRADGKAFGEQFAAMQAKTAADAATGGAAIGDALSTGITGRIEQGGAAMQKQMLDNLNGAVDETTGEAIKGADTIATEFGTSMRGQMGAELSQVHQQVLGGMTKAVDDTQKEAAQGGKDVAEAYGVESKAKLEQEIPKFQTAMNQGVRDGIQSTRQIAHDGGQGVGEQMAAGLQKGVQDQATNIANTAAQTVRDAIHAANQAAGNHSPSRKMREVGDDMGLGLVLGLGGRRGDAEEASRRLVHIPALSPTSAGGVTGRRAYQERGGTTQHITIERLELPSVTNAQELLAELDRWASANGVASGR